MKGPTSKTTATFAEPFRLPGLDELLPAGEYDLETESAAPSDHLDPENWKASVQVRLRPRHSHSGLNRNLNVPLVALEHALARDKLFGRDLVEAFVEEMLSDPIVHLVMAADRVTETEIRQLYGRTSSLTSADNRDVLKGIGANAGVRKGIPVCSPRNGFNTAAIQRAENEGMPPRTPRSCGQRGAGAASLTTKHARHARSARPNH